MQTDQLQTLAALVDEGTFDAAARRLHVTPSAVSQRIKAMEQSAGRVLVQRTTPVTLTPAGDIVLRYARQLELLEADTQRALGATSAEGSATRIPLAVNADSLATWFLGALAGLGEDLGVAFDLFREDEERTTSLLRSGTVMAAVTSTREAVQGCFTEELGAMRYRAVCSPGYWARWFAGDPEIETIGTTPVVQFDRHDDLQETFLRRRTGSGGSGPRHFIPTSDDFARAVVLGFGWGVLPEQQCLSQLRLGTLVELAPSQPVDVPLYWQRWNLGSPLLDAVSDAVRRAAARELRPL